MRSLRCALLVAATLGASCVAPALANMPADATPVQAERVAAGLRQGMPLEDVRKLLGNPKRMTIRSEGSSVSDATRSTQQWTYTWAGTSGNATLRVEFGSKVPPAWNVTSWEWAGP
ncbi:hypothetical protein DSM104443_03034 [Usitatibacter rugosus]|uniref:Lipoprotein SmpA/OmlA domain-containing protein n=1 Tax=Usitatibacter rugosus TaxID=2732067 RepID=A0A6M4GXF3_9PROT|nr:hypothetical protein [Usitatibacter rugosus]QJR11951.1 hypothetical protein DSM104443_03034 [Usitatibacter rugosus]